MQYVTMIIDLEREHVREARAYNSTIYATVTVDEYEEVRRAFAAIPNATTTTTVTKADGLRLTFKHANVIAISSGPVRDDP